MTAKKTRTARYARPSKKKCDKLATWVHLEVCGPTSHGRRAEAAPGCSHGRGPIRFRNRVAARTPRLFASVPRHPLRHPRRPRRAVPRSTRHVLPRIRCRARRSPFQQDPAGHARFAEQLSVVRCQPVIKLIAIAPIIRSCVMRSSGSIRIAACTTLDCSTTTTTRTRAT